jgi:hypothetical protein
MDDQVFSYQTNPEHEKEMHKILELRGKLLDMQQTTKNLPEHTVVVAVAANI